jgi:hypothetical protein
MITNNKKTLTFVKARTCYKHEKRRRHLASKYLQDMLWGFSRKYANAKIFAQKYVWYKMRCVQCCLKLWNFRGNMQYFSDNFYEKGKRFERKEFSRKLKYLDEFVPCSKFSWISVKADEFPHFLDYRKTNFFASNLMFSLNDCFHKLYLSTVDLAFCTGRPTIQSMPITPPLLPRKANIGKHSTVFRGLHFSFYLLEFQCWVY